MSAGISMPVTRPTGRALIVGSAACRAAPLGALQRLGFSCAEVDDPYTAMAELCRRPLVYRAVIMSLTSLYREELALIAAVKRRWPHVDVWLTQTDGRLAALADAMRLGADGLVGDDGLHRTAIGGAALAPPPDAPTPGAAGTTDTYYPVSLVPPDADPDPAAARARRDEEDQQTDPDLVGTEPILTADELRALLAEQPVTLPGDDAE